MFNMLSDPDLHYDLNLIKYSGAKHLKKLTHSLIHHFEFVRISKKLQTTTDMWLLDDFKIQIA